MDVNSSSFFFFLFASLHPSTLSLSSLVVLGKILGTTRGARSVVEKETELGKEQVDSIHTKLKVNHFFFIQKLGLDANVSLSPFSMVDGCG